MQENRKYKFTDALLDLLKELPGTINDLFIRESMMAKSIRLSGLDPKKFYSGFQNLEKRSYITPYKNGYRFTPKGKQWLENTLIRSPIAIPKTWDKKWRVVIFDIPQEFHKNRTNFSRKLKKLGFYTLQKSIFIFPYPCETEISDIAALFNVSDYVDIILADSAGFKEKEIRECFNLPSMP